MIRIPIWWLFVAALKRGRDVAGLDTAIGNRSAVRPRRPARPRPGTVTPLGGRQNATNP